MNKYAKLHLETVEIPPNYMEIMERESVWDYDMFDLFFLSICEITKGICYECALVPFDDESEDMEELNGLIEEKGFEVNGYGWEDYLCSYIEKQNPQLYEKIDVDSESETCGIYVMDSIGDFRLLLKTVSEAIRDLLREV